jgi:formylmethanofuran dehydrogenase subunit C
VSGWTLRAKAVPSLRVDLRGITPAALMELPAAEVERLPVGYGHSLVPLAEFFHIEPRGDDALVFAADLQRCDRVGWQMAGGKIIVEGHVGDYAGGCMLGGELTVQGSAGELAACEMAGGTLMIEGSVGSFAASTLPGSMDGMRGGLLWVKGDAGERFGDRMRRGTAVVGGDVGDFLASRMVAGTIAVGGRCGAHAGYGMRRGSIVFAGGALESALASSLSPPPTFVPSSAEAPVFWQLLARSLAAHGGVFAGLAARGIQRHRGDVAVGGQGEWIVAL